MTSKQAIEDLKTLKNYFNEQTGAAPVCLDFAIETIIEADKQYLRGWADGNAAGIRSRKGRR